MAAEVLFEQVLQNVKSSGLNFKLEQSPYSAYISLKKTFLTDKAGYVIDRHPCAQYHRADAADQQSYQIEQLQVKIESLSSANESLRAKYEHSVNENKNLYKINERLMSELAILKDEKKESGREKEPLEDATIVNLKTEIKSLTLKCERQSKELGDCKRENEESGKTINVQSIKFKSMQRDLKDVEKKKNDEIKTLETKMGSLLEFKSNYDAEQLRLKKKHKKEMKNQKKEIKKAAREALANNNNICKDDSELNCDSECAHTPQCRLRDPMGPPFGPRTELQTHLDDAVIRNETVVKVLEDIKNFLRQDKNDTIDDRIEKVKVLKELLETENSGDTMFDEVINQLEIVKSAIAEMNNDVDYEDNDYDYEEDDLPKYYWGGEDGNEIIFFD